MTDAEAGPPVGRFELVVATVVVVVVFPPPFGSASVVPKSAAVTDRTYKPGQRDMIRVKWVCLRS